jgi:hypothetical protein
MKIFNKVSIVILATAFIFSLIPPIIAFAETPPPLGSILTNNFVILGETGITNAGHGSSIIGNIGNSPGTAAQMDNVFCSEITGFIYGADAAYVGNGTDTSCFKGTPTDNTTVGTAVGDMLTAYNDAAGTSRPLTETADIRSGTLGLGTTFEPGIYKWTTNVVITGDITLHGGPNDIFIFQIAGDLNLAAGPSVVGGTHILLTGGAKASNVFWAVGGTLSPGIGVVLGSYSTFNGIILSAKQITMGTGAILNGRALAQTQVTLIGNTVASPAILRIEKTVVGSSDPASAFTINIKNNLNVLVGTGVGAVTPGTSYSLGAGTYTVSEVANSSYTTLFGTDCVGGSVILAAGDNKLCTIINNFISLSPTSSSGNNNGSFAPLPLINITKIPYPLSLPGGPGVVNYTYTVTNIGVVPMIGVWVKDNKCDSVKFISGDTNNDSVLDLKETWIYRCTKTVSATETNTATAHGQANGWDGYDTANATVVVGTSLTPPLIHLVKVPSVFTLPIGGGAVTYTYTVTNPGTVPLSDVSITDDKCTGLPGRVLGHPGDLNKNDLLDPGEAWQFTCQTNITQTTTNIGTAVGHANGLIAVDLSPATVVVADPNLPSTGFPPEVKNTPWNIIIPSGIFIVLFSFYFARKKQLI